MPTAGGRVIENCVKPVVEANGVSDDVAEINV